MAERGSIDMPPAPCAAFLVSHLLACGLSRDGFAGRIPLSAQELSAWAAGTCTELGPADFQDMLDTSRAYVAAFHDFDTRMVDPPWSPEMTGEEEARHMVAQEKLFDMIMGVADGA